MKGQAYDNAMPAQILSDAEVADVLTYVGSSWGNRVAAFGAEEVALARSRSRFKTYADLVKTAAFQPLPMPPAGWKLREVAAVPEFVTRMAGMRAVCICWRKAGASTRWIRPAEPVAKIVAAPDYLTAKNGDYVTLGMTVAPDGRLWVTSNQKVTEGVPVYTNEVVIWRSRLPAAAGGVQMEQWFTHRYPQGVGGFNHGVSHLAFGADGWLYVSSGSRTDGGEIRGDAHYAPVHEVEDDRVPLAAGSQGCPACDRGAGARGPQRLRLRLGRCWAPLHV